MIATAHTDIFLFYKESSDFQMVFPCSAYPPIQALSLPPSLPWGVGEIDNNKRGIEEIRVTPRDS